MTVISGVNHDNTFECSSMRITGFPSISEPKFSSYTSDKLLFGPSFLLTINNEDISHLKTIRKIIEKHSLFLSPLHFKPLIK